MSSRRQTALLVFTGCLIVLGLVGVLGHYGRVASAATLLISGIIAVGAILTQRGHSPAQEGGEFVELRQKGTLARSEWLDVLINAESELYIAGHSLGKWCDQAHHKRFTTELSRILEDGTVTLVLLHPESKQLVRLNKATGTNYSANLTRSLTLLEGFIETLSIARRSKLRVSLLKDPLALPYMLVGNEHTLLTATYFASRDSDEVPCLTLDRTSEMAVPIYNDFHALALLGDPL
jgi:hypothetical protein